MPDILINPETLETRNERYFQRKVTIANLVPNYVATVVVLIGGIIWLNKVAWQGSDNAAYTARVELSLKDLSIKYDALSAARVQDKFDYLKALGDINGSIQGLAGKIK